MCTLSGSYNTTINEPTGSSPSQILLGMQPRREWDGRELAPDDVTQQPAGDEKAASTAASGRAAALSASLTHVLVEARSPEIRRVGLPEHHAADPVAVFLHASIRPLHHCTRCTQATSVLDNVSRTPEDRHCRVPQSARRACDRRGPAARLWRLRSLSRHCARRVQWRVAAG